LEYPCSRITIFHENMPNLYINNTDNMNDKNDNQIIHESLQELDIEFRNIIIFRDIQELSYDEISKIIQIPLGTVKSRINRGRLKLKEIIKKKGVTL